MWHKLRTTRQIIFVISVLTTSVMAQTPTDSDQARKAAIRMVHSREVPVASLPCTPEESKWWDELRQAARDIDESKGGRKEKDRFLRLLLEGQQKSYQPPIPNQGAIVLSKVPPRYSEEARRRQIKGSVALVLELRPDGYVGEVEVAQGLDRDLDQNAIEAARRTVFLPRVKDRKFVKFMMPVTMSFNIY